MSRLCYLVVASRRKGRDDAIASRPRHVLTDEEDVFDIDAALNKAAKEFSSRLKSSRVMFLCMMEP